MCTLLHSSVARRKLQKKSPAYKSEKRSAQSEHYPSLNNSSLVSDKSTNSPPCTHILLECMFICYLVSDHVLDIECNILNNRVSYWVLDQPFFFWKIINSSGMINEIFSPTRHKIKQADIQMYREYFLQETHK